MNGIGFHIFNVTLIHIDTTNEIAIFFFIIKYNKRTRIRANSQQFNDFQNTAFSNAVGSNQRGTMETTIIIRIIEMPRESQHATDKATVKISAYRNIKITQSFMFRDKNMCKKHDLT
ncbi:hypothetical protein BOW65_11740 [Pseudomonas koreensis]|nr:hypothetical protein BOW65_11740 [Pseudomonas koreensis]